MFTLREENNLNILQHLETLIENETEEDKLGLKAFHHGMVKYQYVNQYILLEIANGEA